MTACGGGGDDGGKGVAPTPPPPPPPPAAPPRGANANPLIFAEQRDELLALPAEEVIGANEVPVRMPRRSAVRFLAQASFGARPEDIEPLRDAWRTGWLEQQFTMPVSRTHWDNVARIQKLPNLTIEGSWDFSIWEMYGSSPDQLRRRAGYALSQIMVVSVAGLIGGGEHRSRCMAAYMDWLEKGAFGNFRDLLTDVTLSPAMGFYLTYAGNRKAEYDAAGKPVRMPDENYAREVMQLFTIGTVELNIDGTPRLVDGKPVPTYQQDDIVNLARVFTGWFNVSAKLDTPDYYERWKRPMAHNPAFHSPEEKRFLGALIPAGTKGPESLQRALDVLFMHPNVGPFIGRQLIQRMVTSNPSPAYVARVARKFNDDGQGVRGNMKAVFTQVLTDPEARSPVPIDRTPPEWGKLREPVLRFLQLIRLLEARPNDPQVWGIPATTDEASSLGQSPGRSPTVFNFYEPDYSPPGTALSARSLVAPEFQLVDEVSVLGLLNLFANTLTNGPRGVTLSFDRFTAVADRPEELVQQLNLFLAHDTLTPATRQLMVSTLSTLPGGAANAVLRVRAGLLMVLASPDYQIQK